MSPSGFAFVANNLTIPDYTPFDLVPGFTFRAASDSEISLILSIISQSIRPLNRWVSYQAKIIITTVENGTRAQEESIPRDEWRYWVVAYEGTGNEVYEIGEVSALMAMDLEFAFKTQFEESKQQGRYLGTIIPSAYMVDKYTDTHISWAPPITVNKADFLELAELWKLYNTHAQQHEYVKTAINSFSTLKRIPEHTSLFVVGLFSIIEALIAHPPRQAESLDSITSQITTKLVLLNKRYVRPVLPETYFQQGNEKNLWKTLYKYRSHIAHGGHVSFDSEFQMLNNHQLVVKFLKDNVKELIKISLREPVFLQDLKNC